jgi:hypothetical protein
MSTSAQQQLETATEERCFLFGPCRDIRGTVSKNQNGVDSWSNELFVRLSPAGKKVSMEAEDIVGNRHQATISEDRAR